METEKKSAQRSARPLALEMRDAKAEIISSVNNAVHQRGIPCFILRGILEEILASVKEIEKNEIEAAEKQYSELLHKEEENK